MIGALLERHPRFANWLYGFTPPERGTVVLVHRRVYIVPTRLGWLFAATLLILLIGSINYALALGFALTFLLGGMALAAMVHTARNLARIGISTGRAEPVFAGESAQFRLHLDGRARFDRPAILARHLACGAQFVVDIPAHAMAEVVLDVPAKRRGWLPLGRVLLETRFPLGLFRAWSYVEPDARCLVYPKPERSALPPPTAEAAVGALHTQSAGNDDFSGLRTYQLSDSPRQVAWKAVARTEHMLTKQFTGEAAAELCLDWALLPAGLGPESRLSRLAGWVLAAERAGANYALRLPGVEIAPARGSAHAAACLEALALYAAS
ncbi:MAG: hypothetical protein A3G81_33400 [Betaproteobacteria bacterium RIFCSPLOWO2_12_FULL_65_14]|nr:MAG: hypothetical protein A3G81_33400 [Betaproteobacteria bacterium RIFCSPLOWO2_12_FULL_65_14]